MSRKQLEIQLSQMIDPFQTPKIQFEQYQTPPRVAANLLHIAWTRSDIEQKKVIDLCAGTGILGLGAVMLGAEEVTLVELEDSAFDLLQSNAAKVDRPVTLLHEDVLSMSDIHLFDTAVLNPPFGIQQKNYRDLDFVQKASQLATEIYCIHDGSQQNQDRLPDYYADIGLEIVEAYIDEFPLDKSYPWHSLDKKIHNVLIIHSRLS